MLTWLDLACLALALVQRRRLLILDHFVGGIRNGNRAVGDDRARRMSQRIVTKRVDLFADLRSIAHGAVVANREWLKLVVRYRKRQSVSRRLLSKES